MKILFIGQSNYGSTSLMRFEMIQKYFGCSVQLINISPIIEDTWKPFRSIGWRFQIGPFIKFINEKSRVRHILLFTLFIGNGASISANN